MRIHHLNCGTSPLESGLLEGHGSRLRRTYRGCHCLLPVTDNAGLVLLDTARQQRAQHAFAAPQQAPQCTAGGRA